MFYFGHAIPFGSSLRSVTIVPLWVPAELRGKELSLSEVEKYAKEPEKYFVSTQRTEVFSVYERISPRVGGYDFMCLDAQFGRQTPLLIWKVIGQIGWSSKKNIFFNPSLFTIPHSPRFVYSDSEFFFIYIFLLVCVCVCLCLCLCLCLCV